MNREQVLINLKAHKNDLQKLGVISLELFGSVARNEATASSDVDLLVELPNDAGFFKFFTVKHYLEDILNCSVDLGMKDCLRPEIKDSVLKDVISVF